jgi:hypothetical protein
VQGDSMVKRKERANWMMKKKIENMKLLAMKSLNSTEDEFLYY